MVNGIEETENKIKREKGTLSSVDEDNNNHSPFSPVMAPVKKTRLNSNEKQKNKQKKARKLLFSTHGKFNNKFKPKKEASEDQIELTNLNNKKIEF